MKKPDPSEEHHSDLNDTECQKAIDLFLEHRSFIRYIALMNAPTVSLVDDIVNEVYLVYVGNLSRWDFSGDIKPILRKITHDVAANHWREYTKTMPDHLEKLAERAMRLLSKKESVSGLANPQNELTALILCIQKLTERSRRLIEEHYYDKKTLADIARETGENLNTLYSRIDRVRIALRGCIESSLEKEDSDV